MKLVFFDLETGGVEPYHPIIQFAGIAVDAQTLEVKEEMEVKLIFDESVCDFNALKANAYDPAIWQACAVSPFEAVARMQEFFKRHATKAMIGTKYPHRQYYVAQPVGHNAAQFDGPRLQALFKAHGTFLPASFLVLDTLQLALWYFFLHPEVVKPENFKLGTLCAYYEIATPEAHDALQDVRYNIELYRRLRSGMHAR